MADELAPETYGDLVRLSAAGLLRLALMLTGNRSDAEDLLQTVLTRCVRHGDRIVRMEAPQAYLRRAIVNEHNSGLRVLQRRLRNTPARHDVRDEVIEPADRAIDDRDEAWRWLAALPARQRTVLVLRYYEDLPDAQIAAILNCGEGTVRSNASRGLAALRQRLVERNHLP